MTNLTFNKSFFTVLCYTSAL